MDGDPRTSQRAELAGDGASKPGLFEEAPSIVRTLGTGWFSVSRLACERPAARLQIGEQEREDTLVVSLHLRPVSRRIVWIDGQQAGDTVLPAHMTCIYDLQSSIAAEVDGPFDVLQFRAPRAALDCLARENDMPRLGELDVRQGAAVADPTVRVLAGVFCPRSKIPNGPAPVRRRTGAGAGVPPDTKIRRRGGPKIDGRTGSMAAAPCHRTDDFGFVEAVSNSRTLPENVGLSTSHFSRAFRQSMGLPPYKWRLDRRVATAKEMMLNGNRSLPEIATDCGFTDQSHLTRVFTGYVGTSPAAWRRQWRVAT